jgi:hypothetical protein
VRADLRVGGQPVAEAVRRRLGSRLNSSSASALLLLLSSSSSSSSSSSPSSSLNHVTVAFGVEFEFGDCACADDDGSVDGGGRRWWCSRVVLHAGE